MSRIKVHYTGCMFSYQQKIQTNLSIAYFIKIAFLAETPDVSVSHKLQFICPEHICFFSLHHTGLHIGSGVLRRT